MKKLLFLLITATLAIACEETPTLTSSFQNFNDRDLPVCQNTDCPKINLDYPFYSGATVVADQLNSNIKSYLITCLYLSEDSPKPQSLEEAAIEFVKANADLKTDFDMDLNYEATATVVETYRRENILTLEKRSYLFTGGAHGYGSVHFAHFDLKTGEELKTSELFHDLKGFITVAEKIFRKSQGLSEEGSINAKGFWFEEDRFRLPEGIGLYEEGLLLIYNQYDIASYADGPIEVSINWKAAAPYLSKTYFE